MVKITTSRSSCTLLTASRLVLLGRRTRIDSRGLGSHGCCEDGVRVTSVRPDTDEVSSPDLGCSTPRSRCVQAGGQTFPGRVCLHHSPWQSTRRRRACCSRLSCSCCGRKLVAWRSWTECCSLCSAPVERWTVALKRLILDLVLSLNTPLDVTYMSNQMVRDSPRIVVTAGRVSELRSQLLDCSSATRILSLFASDVCCGVRSCTVVMIAPPTVPLRQPGQTYLVAGVPSTWTYGLTSRAGTPEMYMDANTVKASHRASLDVDSARHSDCHGSRSQSSLSKKKAQGEALSRLADAI